MTYKETLSYLFSCYPDFKREGKTAYKPGLGNSIKLDAYFMHPHKRYRTIHVGGTNGKGSVSHLLAATLQKAGYRVGLYTSPHIKDFSERIKVNGQPIGQRYVCEFVEKHKEIFEDIHPSFFEATMFMAFKYFEDKSVDVAIIEVGLGGRLDSTNIINPDLSVITNISYDHMDLLGDTLEKIAGEKAGIIKRKTPVVVGEKGSESVVNVFTEKAKAMKAPITFAEDTISVTPSTTTDGNYDCTDFGEIEIELKGIYQIKNIATTLSAIQVLKSSSIYNISNEAIKTGFREVCKITGLRGRWETLQESNPKIICDTGHNEAGFKYIVKQLEQNKYKTLRIVIGMVKDKDIESVIKLLPQDATYYYCNADMPRALTAEEFKKKAEREGLKGETYPTIKDAYLSAINDADKNDLIFVGGSNYTVAEIL